MRRLSSIPAAGAAILILASATACAQNVRVEGVDPADQWRELSGSRARKPQDLTGQLRSFYRYELMHARAACGLSREQLRKLRPEADAAFDRALVELLSAREVRRVDLESREAIRKAVRAVVERHVRRELWAALQADDRRRAEARKQAGVDQLVAQLDRELLLSGDQRRAIASAVSASWDDRWCDPIESVFAQTVRCPDIPEALIAPHLTDVQRAVWRQIPKVQGRPGELVFDHGADLSLDFELGSGRPGPAPKPARKAVRPNWVQIEPPPDRQAVQLRAAEIQAANQRVVILQRANAPVVVRQVRVGVAAPIQQDEGEDAEEAAEAARRRLEERQKQIREIYRVRYFEQRIFGNQGAEDPFRQEAESALAKRVDHLTRACELTDPQRRKLMAAGHGDIKRFLDRVAEARRSFADGPDIRMLLQQVLNASNQIAPDREPILAVEGPIYSRVLAQTLTDDHRAALERDAADRRAFRHRANVRWTAVLLARSLGLVDDRRQRLESLLLDRTAVPRKFETLESAIVLFQASRIPESEIRPIFDEVQWPALSREFEAIQGYEYYLRRGDFFERNTDASRDGPLPRLPILAPPVNRR